MKDSRSDVKLYTHSLLIVGWNPRLSVDAFLGTDRQTEGAQDHSSYVHKLKGRMAYAYGAAAAQAKKYSDRNKEIRQEKSKLVVGDRVLVR